MCSESHWVVVWRRGDADERKLVSRGSCRSGLLRWYFASKGRLVRNQGRCVFVEGEGQVFVVDFYHTASRDPAGGTAGPGG